MEARKLDRKVTLLRATTAPNAFNEPVETWAPLAENIRAERADVSDGERFSSAELAAQISTRFRIRYAATWANLSPRDRLTCEGRTFNIVGVKQIDRRRGLEISAIARAE